MLGRYKPGDVLSVPVTDGKTAVAQVVEKLRGNVLLAVFPQLLDATERRDVDSLDLSEAIFLVETMDQRIKDGAWRVLGNREIAASIQAPTYKVWVEPPGEYREQDVHGRVGPPIPAERAEGMRRQKSFSPAAVEVALRGLHGLGPWHTAFDELMA